MIGDGSLEWVGYFHRSGSDLVPPPCFKGVAMIGDLVLEYEPEQVQVIAWRFGELVRAGYDAEVAIDVAEQLEVDLHRAAALVFHGCPPETAKRILL